MNSQLVGVIKYNVSNYRSVVRALDQINVKALVIDRPEQLLVVSRIILPGVGAFDSGMQDLERKGLAQSIRENVVLRKKPILGICLGLQLLGENSDEGRANGLGLLEGKSCSISNKIESPFSCPNTGWSKVEFTAMSKLLTLVDNDRNFYFTHSHHFIPSNLDTVKAICRNKTKINAVLEHGHIFGTQFHPEKSFDQGKSVLKAFCELGLES